MKKILNPISLNSTNKPKKFFIATTTLIIVVFIYMIIGSNVEVPTQDEPPAFDFNIDRIEVTFEAQNIINSKQKIVVFIENKSSSIFSGNLAVKIKQGEKVIGYDYIFVEDLYPTKKTWAIIWSNPSDIMNATYVWSSINTK